MLDARASRDGRGRRGWCEFRLVQLRDFTHDRHHTVDDYAYGGGAGMVLKPEPFFEAVESLGPPAGPVVLLSARGRRFAHDDAVRFSLGARLTLLCGHYKDVDQRVAERAGHRGAVARRLRPVGRRAGGALRARRGGAAAARAPWATTSRPAAIRTTTGC